jgi:hypothetical protein
MRQEIGKKSKIDLADVPDTPRNARLKHAIIVQKDAPSADQPPIELEEY